MLKTMSRIIEGLVIIVLGFCGCVWASDNSPQDKKPDGNLLAREQPNFPIYSDAVFYKYAKGRVFFIIGTSSAGKSSIIKNLSKYIPQAKKRRFLISGNDNLIETIILKNLRCKFTGGLSSITQKDLLYCFSATRVMAPDSILARLDTDVIFKKHRQLLLSEEWHNALSQLNLCPFLAEDKRSFAENLMLTTLKGKNIILDVVKFMPFLFALESNFIRCEIHNIYVYSPPHALIQRITQRLQESLLTADKAEMRLFFPYRQYLDLYMRNHSNTGMCLTKEEILPDFTDIFGSIIENSKLPDLEKIYLFASLQEFAKMVKPWRKKIICEWFPGNTEVIYLKPTCPKVDLLLDTSSLSTNEAVSAILPILNSVINRE